MPKGRAVAIALDPQERAALERNARTRTGAVALAQRSRIVLLAARGLTNQEIANELDMAPATVGVWRRRFAEHRMDGLVDAPRLGRPRLIDSARVEAVVAAALSQRGDENGRRSTRAVARQMGISQSAVSRIWRASGYRPERRKRGRRRR